MTSYKELKDLLEEASEWLCTHSDTYQDKKLAGEIRVWCSSCSNYLRSQNDVNLLDRIIKALQNARQN